MDRRWTAKNIDFQSQNARFWARARKRCVWSLYSSLGRGAPNGPRQNATIQAPNAPLGEIGLSVGEAYPSMRAPSANDLLDLMWKIQNLNNRVGAFGERIVARAARVVRAPHELINN